MEAVRKAAILLLTLEKPIAAEVLSQLSKSMVEQVTLEIAQIDDVTKEQVETVLKEFRGLARERVPIERGGLEFANDLLKQSLGTEGAGEILENVRNSMNSVPFVVTVKVTHRLSGASAASKNTSGWPNSCRPFARRFHNAQDRPPPGDRDGVFMVPAARSATCDPVVTSTISSGAISTEVAALSRS